MRRVSRLSLLLAFGLLPFWPAEARERLVMPYDCGVEGGAVRLTPTAETSYRIVGMRDEQSVTTCPPGASAACRTMMVHRFTISCAGKRASWIDVAAAIRTAAANRAWIEDGRLNLLMPVRNARRPSFDCSGRHQGDLQRRLVVSGDCLPWPRKAAFEHLVLPEGYAPIGEMGARLMIGAAADEAAIASGKTGISAEDPQLRHVVLTDEGLAVAKADPDAILEPSGHTETLATALDPDIGEDNWITVVRAGPDEVPAAPPAKPAPRLWAWLTAFASASVIALLFAMRYGPMLRVRLRGKSAFRMAHGDLTLANASEAVAALIEQTEEATHDLMGAGPLREVLGSELGRLRGRLSNLDRLAAKGELPAERSAPQFRALVRELERIRRIVDSAAASLSGAKKTAALPRTASEAYEVLGVNAEVSAGVLKKIVDALRMSWHPDHARDENDRMLRETRIRQINIAWDLINGKREAA